jgi:hypothetical protein
MDNDIVPIQPAELQVTGGMYDRISDPMLAIKTLGMSIFKSGIFGLDKPEQGEILAMQCLVEKKSPLELARTYHFIQGQLAIRSDALLAKYQLAGGKVEWIERTDDEVRARFYRADQSAVITASMKEYVGNGTATKADGKTLKDNWKRWPRRMLTARAISEGVRLIAPECCFGTYTVEELEQPKVVDKKSYSTLDEIIPEGKVPQAIQLLQKTHHLLVGEDLSHLSPATVESILKKPQAFIDAINSL